MPDGAPIAPAIALSAGGFSPDEAIPVALSAVAMALSSDFGAHAVETSASNASERGYMLRDNAGIVISIEVECASPVPRQMVSANAIASAALPTQEPCFRNLERGFPDASFDKSLQRFILCKIMFIRTDMKRTVAHRRVWLITASLLVACAADPGYQGRSSSEWIQRLHDENTGTRIVAAESLGKILRINPRMHDITDALVTALGDSSDAVRLSAANALTTRGVDVLGAMAGLHAVLHDTAHANVRASMALLIGALGAERARILLPHLKEALSDPSAPVRAAAAQAFGVLGSAERGNADAVARLAGDPDATVRQSALQSLSDIGADKGIVLAAGRTALSDSAVVVRVAAAYMLSTLGRDAGPALADLVAATRDTSSRVREGAAFAIGSIGAGASSAIPNLEKLFGDVQMSVRQKARDAITAIETQSNPGR